MISINVIKGESVAADLMAIEAGISQRTARRMNSASVALQREIRLSSRATFKPGRGKLAQSWQIIQARVRGKGVEGGTASNMPYAAIQESGGTVRPVTAGALTIPLTQEARRRRARDYADLFLYKSPLGKLFLARQMKRSGGRGTLEMVYLLVKSVTLKPTHYITKAEKAAEPEITGFMDQAVQDELAAFARKN